MNKTWSESAKKFVRDNAATMKDIEIAEKISEMLGKKVSLQAVRKQRQKMGIKKSHGRGICALAKKPAGTTSDSVARTVQRNVQNV